MVVERATGGSADDDRLAGTVATDTEDFDLIGAERDHRVEITATAGRLRRVEAHRFERQLDARRGRLLCGQGI